MDCTDDIQSKFLEFEKAMEVCLSKVDKRFIIELLGELIEDDYPGITIKKLKQQANCVW